MNSDFMRRSSSFSPSANETLLTLSNKSLFLLLNTIITIIKAITIISNNDPITTKIIIPLVPPNKPLSFFKS